MCWNEKKFIDPDDTSSDNFRSICETLKKYIIKEGCKGNTDRAKKMRDFYFRNQRFCYAFELKKRWKNKWNKKYKLLSDNDKKMVNLYYLSIAHTINSSEYRIVSSFVSTSTNSRVAEQFTGNVTIYGWVPESSMQKDIKTIDYVITKYGFNIKRLGLPYCETPVYPEQKEIALRCGILPHFIIGFKVKGKPNFYVNPAIFSSIDKMKLDDIICDGLKVDQNGFEEFCNSHTKFKRFYTFDGNKYEIHVLDKN